MVCALFFGGDVTGFVRKYGLYCSVAHIFKKKNCYIRVIFLKMFQIPA